MTVILLPLQDQHRRGTLEYLELMRPMALIPTSLHDGTCEILVGDESLIRYI